MNTPDQPKPEPDTVEAEILQREESQTRPNALKHGIYSEQVVLPWERVDEFEPILRSYQDELNPEGALENDIVGQIAQLQWFKRRLLRHHKMQLVTHPHAGELAGVADQGYPAVEQFVCEGRIANTANAGNKGVLLSPSQLEAVIDRMVAQAKNGGGVPDSTKAPEPKPVKAIVKDLKDRLEMEAASECILDQVYRPQAMGRLVRELGSLDSRIDKAIGRLVTIKEYKARYGKKTITAH